MDSGQPGEVYDPHPWERDYNNNGDLGLLPEERDYNNGDDYNNNGDDYMQDYSEVHE